MVKTALITGATSGIGLELAQMLARNGVNLVIISRDEQKLKTAKEKLEKFNIQVKTISIDLAQVNAARKVYKFTEKNGIKIDFLINNAGFGSYGDFKDVNLDRQIDMIQTNITSLTALTHVYLPHLITCSGKIMNVASTAAFQPGPYMAVYYATKAYVLHFSEAIAEELTKTNVTVTCLCPGPTYTDFHITANLGKSKLLDVVSPMSAKRVAEIGFKAMMRGKRIAIPGFRNNLLNTLIRFTPRKVVVKIMKKIQEKK